MDYHLKPPGKTCAATGEPLVPGSHCHSVLVEQDGQLVRLDFSEKGWTGPPHGTIGQWRTKVAEQDEKPKPLDLDALMRYFEQLQEDATPAQEKLRYVVSLLLLQKRRLKFQGSRQEGDVETLELIGSHGEGPFDVRNCNLSEPEMNELQKSLQSHLAAEWS